jgi:hypothetical protein
MSENGCTFILKPIVVIDAEAAGGISLHNQYFSNTCWSQSQLWAPIGWRELKQQKYRKGAPSYWGFGSVFQIKVIVPFFVYYSKFFSAEQGSYIK